MSLKLNLSILGILLISICSAQINFSKDSWEDILAQAKKENKSIFVDVYTTWCGPCKKLSKTTFQDEALGKDMNASFISTKWDAESDAHESLADQYEVNSYPTLLYFNSNGELIKKESGFKKVDEMQEMNDAFFAFVNNPDLRKRLEDYASLNLEETSQLLSELKGIKLKEKKNAALQLLELIGDNDDAWSSNYEIIVDNRLVST